MFSIAKLGKPINTTHKIFDCSIIISMIKKLKLTLVIVYAFSSLSVVFLLQSPSQVGAASCSTSGVVGTVNSSVSIPASGEYVLWVRMLNQSQAQNSLLIEVEGNTCFSVGSNSLPLNQWTWVNYQGSTTSNIMKYTFNSSGTKNIKFLFKNYTTQLDKMILLGSSEQCGTNGNKPSGDGGNCASAPVASPSNPSNPPATSVPISTVPENIPTEEIEKIEYFIDGQLVQETQGAEELDTTEIKDGNYELTTRVTKKDGSIEEIKQPVVIKDNQTLSQETITEASEGKLKLNPIAVIASLLIITLSAGTIFLYIRKYKYHKKLYKQHHGLIQ